MLMSTRGHDRSPPTSPERDYGTTPTQERYTGSTGHWTPIEQVQRSGTRIVEEVVTVLEKGRGSKEFLVLLCHSLLW